MSRLKDLYLTFLGILKYYTFLNRSQFFTVKQIERYQFKKLKKLLCESYTNIPFYSQSFKSSNFNPFYDFNMFFLQLHVKLVLYAGVWSGDVV
jgi:hypothetical protein